jgi:hypothetical protein
VQQIQPEGSGFFNCNDGIDNDCDGFTDVEDPDCDSVDCNGNSIPDNQDIAQGTSADCNGNLVPDECDIVSGTSQDCQPDGVPDECQLTDNDCNMNGVPDECESLVGCLNDWDCDGVPDASDVCLCTPCFAAVDAEGRPEGDIDKDCDVDLNDFARFANNFGATNCP